MCETKQAADAAGSKKLTNTEAVALLQEMGNYERHFNQLQSTYRSFASAWLLAAFGAMGYVLTQTEPDKLLLPTNWLVAAVALAACIGILLLWNMDMWVYHRLLEGCFDTAHDLESCYDLPAFRERMRQALGKGWVSWAIALYYGVPGVILALIGFVSLFWKNC